MTAAVCEGFVKWFNAAKGYGFVAHPDGDVFVHYSAIVAEGYRKLDAGDRVRYEVVPNGARLQARNVVRLEG